MENHCPHPDRGAVGLRRRAIHESPLHARRHGARSCVGAHGLPALLSIAQHRRRPDEDDFVAARPAAGSLRRTGGRQLCSLGLQPVENDGPTRRAPAGGGRIFRPRPPRGGTTTRTRTMRPGHVGAAREPPSLPNGTHPDRGAVDLRAGISDAAYLHGELSFSRTSIMSRTVTLPSPVRSPSTGLGDASPVLPYQQWTT
jgi:hypothetical protein